MLCVQLEAVCSERLVSNVNVVKTQLRCVCPRFFYEKRAHTAGKAGALKKKGNVLLKIPNFLIQQPFSSTLFKDKNDRFVYLFE